MTTQEVPIFIALQVAFVKTWYQSQATAVVSGQLPDLAGLLDAFAARNTHSRVMKSQLLMKKPIPLRLSEICSWINS